MNRFWKRVRSLRRHPLAGRLGLRPLYAYGAYHLRRRLRSTPGEYAFVGPLRLIGFHEAGVTGNIFHGLHDFEEMSFLLHVLREGDLFLDVGANCGSYALLAAGICGSDAIAIEPVPQTYERLVAHIERNGLSSRIRPVLAGVGREPGRARMSTNKGAMNRIVRDDLLPEVGARPDVTEVEIQTLDAILASRSPYLMKMDVEGFEFDALQGASAMLADPGLAAIIIELNGSGRAYGHNDEEVHDLLGAAGFSPHRYDPATRSLTQRAGYNREGFNTIYVRSAQLADLVTRVQQGAPFRVRGRTL